MQATATLPIDTEVSIPVGRDRVYASLAIPAEPRGFVIFAHGSGSSRFSPRNASVARALQHAQLGTLLLDLLTPAEDTRDAYTKEYRFNIPLLARRLVAATEWAKGREALRGSAIGYFGASTGSAAALLAAAELRETVVAVVSRGGRPDLAGPLLPRVTAATLLIVGGGDYVVVEINEQSYEALKCEKHLAIVPGATHLFDEPGALEEVCALAESWFATHFSRMLQALRKAS
jgi:dienelactone hydrolase